MLFYKGRSPASNGAQVYWKCPVHKPCATHVQDWVDPWLGCLLMCRCACNLACGPLKREWQGCKPEYARAGDDSIRIIRTDPLLLAMCLCEDSCVPHCFIALQDEADSQGTARRKRASPAATADPSAPDRGDSKRTRKASLNNLARAGPVTTTTAGQLAALPAQEAPAQEHPSMYGLIIGTRVGVYWDGDNVFYRVSDSVALQRAPDLVPVSLLQASSKYRERHWTISHTACLCHLVCVLTMQLACHQVSAIW